MRGSDFSLLFIFYLIKHCMSAAVCEDGSRFYVIEHIFDGFQYFSVWKIVQNWLFQYFSV